MIVVTGATGHYGREVVENLMSRMPSTRIGASVRDLKKATDLTAKGVRVTQGDFAAPDTLAAAFDGAEQVLLVSANVLGEEAIRLHGNAIQAAKAAGVKRILYTSHQAASLTSKVAFARDHAATEALLRSSGVPFISLRNGFYAESALYQLGRVRETGTLALPEDGPVSWTAREDLAEAAAEALIDQTLFDGITPPLTGVATYTFSDVARFFSEILGREIVRQVMSNAAYHQNALQRGYPHPMADMLLSMFEAIQDGEFNVVNPMLVQVLGRRPTELKETLTSFFADSKSRSGHI